MTKPAQRATPRQEAAEFVLPGHPDKLCDAAVDAIVDLVRQIDPRGQCGLEAGCIFDRFFLTGRIALRDERLVRWLLGGELARLVRDTYASAGYGVDAAGHVWEPQPQTLRIAAVQAKMLNVGGFEPGEAQLRHLSDDQAICVGHAVRSPKTDWLPPAHWLARRIGRELVRLRAERGAGHLGPDGKVIVHGVRDGGPETFCPRLVSLSLHHHVKSDWLLLRQIAEEAVETACAGWPLPEIVFNGAGMFVCGGPNGDNGQTGKKIVVDAYGPGVPVGGGAWSGKDFFKVDRLGALAARRIALQSLLASDASEATVTLTYLPGGDRPARIDLHLDGAPSDAVAIPRSFGQLETARLQPLFVKASAKLPELARWGHQRQGMPWELPARRPRSGEAHACTGATAAPTTSNSRPPHSLPFAVA
jgi:S-adenosylmethionine synthetase